MMLIYLQLVAERRIMLYIVYDATLDAAIFCCRLLMPPRLIFITARAAPVMHERRLFTRIFIVK